MTIAGMIRYAEQVMEYAEGEELLFFSSVLEYLYREQAYIDGLAASAEAQR